MEEEKETILDEAAKEDLKHVVTAFETAAIHKKTLAKNAQYSLLAMILSVVILFLVFEGYIRPAQENDRIEELRKSRQENFDRLETIEAETTVSLATAEKTREIAKRGRETIYESSRRDSAVLSTMRLYILLLREYASYQSSSYSENNIEHIVADESSMTDNIHYIMIDELSVISKMYKPAIAIEHSNNGKDKALAEIENAEIENVKSEARSSWDLGAAIELEFNEIRKRWQVEFESRNEPPWNYLRKTFLLAQERFYEQMDRVRKQISIADEKLDKAQKNVEITRFKLDSVRTSLEKARIDPSNNTPDPDEWDKWQLAKESLLRIGAVVLILYLAQILVTYSRYHFRVSDQLFAQAKALDIAIRSGNLNGLEPLIKALAPQIEFGKAPATPTDKVLDTVKAAVEKIRVS